MLDSAPLCVPSAPAGALSNTARSDGRPNILLMIADDHRADALGALGSQARTPRLDRLAGEGAHFTHAFTTVPICTPARAELLAGCDALRAGVPWFGMPINPGFALLPQVLEGAGYETFFTGKWHNDGAPAERGFGRSRRVFQGGMGPHEMSFEEGGQVVSGFSSELFAGAMIEFLQEGPKENPWFAMAAFTSPHDPRTPPEEFARLYDPDKIELPPNFMPEHPFDNGAMAIRDELLDEWPRTPGSIRRHLADYYGMVSELDAQVGRVLDALEASGQAQETIVVYMADHGLAVGSHGLMGKENLYDHSVRVPLLVRGPGIEPGRRPALCCGFDVTATLLDLAHAPRPEHATGRSLRPLLRPAGSSSTSGASSTWEAGREEVFGAFTEAQRSVRTGRWKLIHYPQIGRWQLFDLDRDTGEGSDLAQAWRYRPWSHGRDKYFEPTLDRSENEAVARSLHARLVAWQREVGDPLAGALAEPSIAP